eukprot:gene44728-59710_t
MVSTMPSAVSGLTKQEGYTGLIHTAAASNLGQMLVKICLKDGIPLVNIVRSDEQEEAWRWVEPIMQSWAADAEGPRPYAAGTWGPSASSAMIARDGYCWTEEWGRCACGPSKPAEQRAGKLARSVSEGVPFVHRSVDVDDKTSDVLVKVIDNTVAANYSRGSWR